MPDVDTPHGVGRLHPSGAGATTEVGGSPAASPSASETITIATNACIRTRTTSRMSVAIAAAASRRGVTAEGYRGSRETTQRRVRARREIQH